MKKYVLLTIVGFALLMVDFLLGDKINTHEYYPHLVVFFVSQTSVLFLIDQFASENLKAQIRLLSIGLRMVSAFAALLVIMLSGVSDQRDLYLQFIILYLVFMIFEISLALTKLRRD